MTTVCTPTPTLTSTITATRTSFSTTSTTSVTTIPGTTSVTTITCAPQPTSSGVSTAPACVPIVSTITIPGNTSTITIPVTVPVDVFITDTTTLFGTACSTSIPPSVPPTVTPTSTPPPIVSNPPTSNSSSSVLPSSIASNNSTSATGTSSSSQAAAPSNTLQNPPSSSGKSSSVGPIVGGVVGGLAVLLLLGFFTLRFIKKQHRFDSLFNDKDDDRNSTTPFRKNPLESDFNPAFNYNPIGQQKAPSGITPPSSPPPGASPFNNPAHGRRPSITPLLGGAAAFGASNATASSTSYNNNGNASGASTVSSQQALAPMPAGNVQSQGYFPPQAQQNIAGPGSSGAPQPMSYPPKPQPVDTWNAATLYGPSTSSNATTAYTGGGLSANPSVGSSSVAQQSSVSGLGYATSVGSASMTTAVSSSWGVQSAAASSSSSSAARRPSTQTGFVVSRPQASQPAVPAQAQQAPMLYSQYEDPFARSGSPVSIQEQRILQVVNAEPSSPSHSSYALQPQASSFHVANLGPLEQEQVGASGPAGANANVRQDGAGRPMSSARDEKGVHLDGAMYQRQEAASPAPPAYQL